MSFHPPQNAPQCKALISSAWSDHQCSRWSKTERAGRPLCTQHAKTYDERGYSFAVFWWHWPKREGASS